MYVSQMHCPFVNVLRIQQPNIISLEKVFKTENTMYYLSPLEPWKVAIPNACYRYIFQDLLTAGDLFSFLEFKNGRLLAIEAAVIVRQILIALN